MKNLGALLLTVLVACGGGSSVDGDTKLVDLTASQQTDVCNDVISMETTRTITCGSGSDTATITQMPETLSACQTGLAAQIAANPSCAATVAESEACVDGAFSESEADLCAGSAVAACAPLEGSDCTAQ